MKFWIDTEFNDFRGELISMALVGEDGREFYAAVEFGDPEPWIANHVVPVIEAPLITRMQFDAELLEFLAGYSSLHVISDWPDDIKHFCDALHFSPGVTLWRGGLTFEVRFGVPSPDQISKIPHNALEDARACARVSGF